MIPWSKITVYSNTTTARPLRLDAHGKNARFTLGRRLRRQFEPYPLHALDQSRRSSLRSSANLFSHWSWPNGVLRFGLRRLQIVQNAQLRFLLICSFLCRFSNWLSTKVFFLYLFFVPCLVFTGPVAGTYLFI